MTLTQAMALGSTGEEINDLLDELLDAALQSKTNEHYEFEDLEHQQEYLEDTINMIKLQLTNLKQK